MAKIKKTVTSAGCRETRTLLQCWTCKKAVWKTVEQLPNDLAVTFLGIHPRKLKTCTQKMCKYS